MSSGPESPGNDFRPSGATSSVATPSRRSLLKRGLVFLTVLVVASAAYFLFGDQLTLKALAAHEKDFRDFQQARPALVYLITFAAYVGVTALSLPGAVGMTLLTAWLFGFWPGLLVASFASTTGALLAFLLSRYLLRDAIRARFGRKLQAFNAALKRDGVFFLLTLRLLPIVPYFIINLVMGLTPMPARTFAWVSQVGMLPGAAAYVYAGSRIPSLQTLADNGLRSVVGPELLLALLILGLLPLAVRFALGRFRRPIAPEVAMSGDETPPRSSDPRAN